MNFFSGFSLEGEESLFSPYLKENDFCVSGFSLGAILAYEYVLNSSDRVDTLQLFSPAFFQNESEKFKRVQTINYQKNRDSYQMQFLKNIAYPADRDLNRYLKNDSIVSLEKLLYFRWDANRLKELKDRGINIEVYLGGKDRIMDTKKAYDFFKKFATIYLIKNGGHILETKD